MGNKFILANRVNTGKRTYLVPEFVKPVSYDKARQMLRKTIVEYKKNGYNRIVRSKLRIVNFNHPMIK